MYQYAYICICTTNLRCSFIIAYRKKTVSTGYLQSIIYLYFNQIDRLYVHMCVSINSHKYMDVCTCICICIYVYEMPSFLNILITFSKLKQTRISMLN